MVQNNLKRMPNHRITRLPKNPENCEFCENTIRSVLYALFPGRSDATIFYDPIRIVK